MFSTDSWTTFQGKSVSFDTIDHQHLSNCYWFARVIWNVPETDLHLLHIENKLAERFNGQLLPYRPHRDFGFEINELKRKRYLSHDNQNPNRIIIHNGNYEIGEIICTSSKRIILDEG